MSPPLPPTGFLFVHRSLSQGLYRVNETRKAAQPFLQHSASPGRVERPLPNLFTLFKGEFWVALHRDFCEYVHESPDNVARSLQVRSGSERGGMGTFVCLLEVAVAFMP